MNYILGIDIGTTNIEYALSIQDSNDVTLFIERNPLYRYGLDVMTRITKANSGLLDEMCSVLRNSISDRINELISKTESTDVSIRIAANTTMVHLLMGYDCTNLGSYPFSPVHIEKIETTAQRIGLYDAPFPVIITPGLSAFVGGDIVSGLSALPRDNNFLLIDLGTNAEMVLVKDNTAYITSAAAGPAFETCSYGHATDAIDGMASMLKSGIMDETGLICDEYFESGYDCNNMHFSMKKIRDFQMAKAAIRTGIDLLIDNILKDINKNNINELLDSSFKIYIAGNFGAKLNIVNSIYLKMFPGWFLGRCEVLGNTSLAGTLSERENHKIFSLDIKELTLANHPDFNSRYIENMNF